MLANFVEKSKAWAISRKKSKTERAAYRAAYKNKRGVRIQRLPGDFRQGKYVRLSRLPPFWAKSRVKTYQRRILWKECD